MEFETTRVFNQLRPQIAGTARIDITDAWIYGTTVKTKATDPIRGTYDVSATLPSLDICTSVFPIWEMHNNLGTHDIYQESCGIWLPQARYRELNISEHTYIAIDTSKRRDGAHDVKWTKGQSGIAYTLTLDGKDVTLDAISATTNKGDSITVLSDEHNAVILSLKSQFFSWKLKSIRTR